MVSGIYDLWSLISGPVIPAYGDPEPMLVVFYVVCVLYLYHVLYFSTLWLFGGRGQ